MSLIELLGFPTIAVRIEHRFLAALEERRRHDVLDVRPHLFIAQEVIHLPDGGDMNVVDDEQAGWAKRGWCRC